MQLASCIVCLTKENQVPKPSVTPPEVAILRAMHQKNYGGDPIIEVKVTREDWKGYNPFNEIARLRAKYGNVPKTGVTYFDTLFPGATNNPTLIPSTFKSVEYVPAEVTASHQAPSRAMIPGEPGYEEPVKFSPPVPQSPVNDEPEA